ncbi:MAG: UvrD-helicase domain-containing protein, partial [Oscillospiraceae bacterium]|nr:UvrD-helicase domain-containing protein [Oscillospiraceae bacterium]
MSEVKLTRSQQAVVDNEGGALLVSAAAGSGKTKVLVDRLLKRVCDYAHPANLDEFLIITYTKAAAAELREKIAKELSERLARDPENLHLQRQSARVCLAQISTVHAFCTSILRTYAHTLNIPADFRVA